jgi:hypothetical protein
MAEATAIVVTAATEGIVDEAVVCRLIREVGAEPGPVHGKNGKRLLRSDSWIQQCSAICAVDCFGRLEQRRTVRSTVPRRVAQQARVLHVLPHCCA